MRYPDYIQELITRFAKLPSVGPKTAERYVFHLLESSPADLQALAASLSELPRKAKKCSICLAYSSQDPCPICSDKERTGGTLCIVENIQDLAVIENTRQYTGRYFVLGGLLNTLEGIGPEELPIAKLKERIREGKITEVILALNFTLEGESTALYLKKIFPDIKLSRLARGLPAGSDLEYADELTLANALKFRNNI
ncbi:MAG: recombination mediator RecR [Bacillota bacterium]